MQGFATAYAARRRLRVKGNKTATESQQVRNDAPPAPQAIESPEAIELPMESQPEETIEAMPEAEESAVAQAIRAVTARRGK